MIEVYVVTSYDIPSEMKSVDKTFTDVNEATKYVERKNEAYYDRLDDGIYFPFYTMTPSKLVGKIGSELINE